MDNNNTSGVAPRQMDTHRRPQIPGIRYWDENKPALAIAETEKALSLLEEYDLPLGCVQHNLDSMTYLQVVSCC